MKIYREKDYIDPKENINIFKSDENGGSEIHTHEFVEIVYIYSGSAVQNIEGNEYEVKEGDLLIIDEGQKHAFSIGKNFSYVNIILKPEFISDELINTANIFDVFALAVFDDFDGNIERNMRIVSFEENKKAFIMQLMDSMLLEFKNKDLGYKSALKGYINILFSWVLRAMQTGKSEQEMHYVGKITPEIISYIEKNLSEKITLQDIAARSFYTPSYFCRIFRQCCGTTLKSYIKQKRIERAKKYLSETDISVEKIVENVGYGDRVLFFRHFKELAGMTPNEYRQKCQNNTH